MKPFIFYTVLLIGAGLLSPALAQSNADLEISCNENTELVDAILQVLNGSTTSSVLSNDEIAEIQAVLNDSDRHDAEIQKQLDTVITACSQNRIFKERHSYITERN